MKKTMARICILVILLLTTSSAALADSHFPLYEVRMPGCSATVYLFPSIHAANESAYPLSQAVKSAYEASEYLAVECDIIAAESIANQVRMTRRIKLPDGQTVYNYVSQEVYDRVKEYLAGQGMYVDMYEQYHPYMLMSMLELAQITESGLDYEYGLDRYFLELAKDENKSILEIESVDEQMDLLMNRLSPHVWDVLLESYLPPEKETSVLMTRLMYDAMLVGDATAISGLLAMEESFVDEADAALYAQYTDVLLTQRDAKMQLKVLEYLRENKNVFVVVGAAHVLGPTGLVDSLKEAGCAVRRIG
ncbi:MAG: TraB/GumN family protein [Clostridiales bacterium]|nr:TraB/GumN family protein [Clostridiales bacterium]